MFSEFSLPYRRSSAPMIKTGGTHLFLGLVISSLLLSSSVAAQAPPTTRPSETASVVGQRPVVPQVVTVLHRVNGLKMLRLLLRSGQALGAFESADEAFGVAGQVHTNISAGLALDDGQTIVAWLPDAEAEVESPFPSVMQPNGFGIPESSSTQTLGSWSGFGTPPQSTPDLAIIERDGKRHKVNYIGLDGITGLSLLRLAGQSLSASGNAGDQEVYVGQRMRLFSPEPAPRTEPKTSAGPLGGNNVVYVRIGETEGQVVSVARGAAGRLSRIRVRSANLSAANIGAVAVNDLGQTVGIVDGIEGSEASVLPPEVIRGAATRISARQSSVPRPWLGVRGEPVAGAAFEQILRNGWQRDKAMSLFGDRRGILLTSIVPGSPAALAALRPGDVILQVNDGEVRSEDDFSSLLDEVGGGNQVRFTVARPDLIAPEAIVVRLSGSLDPLFATRMLAGRGPHTVVTDPLLQRGIETIVIRPRGATHPSTATGLMVVYVQPESPASKSGLRPGDVIEALNNRAIFATSAAETQKILNAASYSLNVVRNKQKVVLKVISSAP